MAQLTTKEVERLLTDFALKHGINNNGEFQTMFGKSSYMTGLLGTEGIKCWWFIYSDKNEYALYVDFNKEHLVERIAKRKSLDVYQFARTYFPSVNTICGFTMTDQKGDLTYIRKYGYTDFNDLAKKLDESWDESEKLIKAMTNRLLDIMIGR